MDHSADPAQYLASKLRWLDLLLHREIVRFRAKYQMSLDELRGLYISDEQVDRLIDRTYKHDDASATRGLTQQAEILREAARKHEPIAWKRIVSEFSLSLAEQDILLLALGPELDLKYETLFGYLNNDVTRKWPTHDLAMRVFGEGAENRAEVRRCLSAEENLFRSGLLQPLSSVPERPSWLASGFTVSPMLLDSLWEMNDPQSTVGRRVTAISFSDIPTSPALRSVFSGIVNFTVGDQAFPLIALAGREGLGQKVAAEAVCSDLGISLDFVDLAGVRPPNETLVTLLRRVLLRQRLKNSGLYLERADVLFDQQDRVMPESSAVIKLLTNVTKPIFIACESDTQLKELLAGHRALIFSFDAPDYSLRLKHWDEALAPFNLTITRTELESLADSFVLTPHQISTAVLAAVDQQTMIADPLTNENVTLSSDSLFAAARALSDQSIARLAVKVKTIHKWKDLILPEVTLQRIKEIAAAIRYRHVVYSTWKFEDRIASGKGLKALFTGSSGTGKTMTAGVIARELSLDMYKIDLSAIVSKYIGETEKNLDQIFRAAQSSNAILFFDEADALFGKRSEVKDAHDRYANIEVAYLLQQIEEYEGVVILASNLSKNIDEAFSRRVHYVAEFPLPDENLRERLWRGMFPPTVPMSTDVDFSFLARQFPIAGGDIRNVALDAAFLAAQNGQIVTMKQLIRAMAQQLGKLGRIPSPADFKQYHSMLGRPA